MNKELGGDRIGSGNKIDIPMSSYSRSTHDLGYRFKTTMAPGTLVPFMCEIVLPGDTMEIDLNCDVLTLPTIGPLFGSMKVQLDVFKIPIRLYNKELHMDMLEIGNDMSKVKLPQLLIKGLNVDLDKPLSNQQINTSSLFSYLNIRGLGHSLPPAENNDVVTRSFNAGYFMSYFDVYKNFYANKQEDDGWIIHNELIVEVSNVSIVQAKFDGSLETLGLEGAGNEVEIDREFFEELELLFVVEGQDYGDLERYKIRADWEYQNVTIGRELTLRDMFDSVRIDDQGRIECSLFYDILDSNLTGEVEKVKFLWWSYDTEVNEDTDTRPRLVKFPLKNIDEFKLKLMTEGELGVPYYINNEEIAPYGLPLLRSEEEDKKFYSATSNQEGLLLKTYQSDLFNNWVDTEAISGENGINDITKVTVDESGSFTIDEINLQSKIHRMLMRIGVSGGSYNDWQEAVYSHDGIRKYNSPMYIGGLIKELGFQEIVSNAAEGEQPLGTLAGRGQLTGKHKGGKVKVTGDEICYLMGIVSITPRLDYSQGNKWDTNLRTMDDFHKPALDAIGFQDLITDQMSAFDTGIFIGVPTGEPRFKSAGKQPAWINYMTNVNVVRGNFADRRQQQFMVFDRDYELEVTDAESKLLDIKDLTTYIDPSKYNHIFADTRLDAQNFWVQINVENQARRKMSAKLIPNL